MASIYKVQFVLRDSKQTVTETVKQPESNALNAAVAKYYRSKRTRDFHAAELARQIKYQIAWLRKNRYTYKITKVE